MENENFRFSIDAKSSLRVCRVSQMGTIVLRKLPPQTKKMHIFGNFSLVIFYCLHSEIPLQKSTLNFSKNVIFFVESSNLDMIFRPNQAPQIQIRMSWGDRNERWGSYGWFCEFFGNFRKSLSRNKNHTFYPPTTFINFVGSISNSRNSKI